MNTATNIAQLLKLRGWSDAQLYAALADHGCSVSPFTVRAWLTGIRSPRAKYVVAIAEVIGCTTDAILVGPPTLRESA